MGQVYAGLQELADQAQEVLGGGQIAADKEHGGTLLVLGEAQRLAGEELGNPDLAGLEDEALRGVTREQGALIGIEVKRHPAPGRMGQLQVFQVVGAIQGASGERDQALQQVQQPRARSPE